MTRTKKIWIGGLIGLGVAGLIGYGFFAGNTKKPEIVSTQIQRETLKRTVEATGELESIDKIDLSFETVGTLADVFVKVGDEVKMGDLLADLESNELGAGVEQARQAVQVARANLQQKAAGATLEAVSVAESAVRASEASLHAAEIDLENTQEDLVQTQDVTDAQIKEAEVALASASTSLENILLKNTELLSEASEDLYSVLVSGVISVRSALSDADEVLGIDNSLANDDFEDVLSVLDSSALIHADTAYEEASRSMDTAETSVYGLEATSDPSAIETSAGLVQTVLDDVAVTLLYTREALDATTSDSATFTAAELSALKAKIDTAREDIQKQNDKLLTQEQTIASLEISTNTDEDTAKNKVTELTQSVSSVKTEQASKMAKAEAVVSAATAAVEVGKADVEQKQMKLAEVQASPRSVDLAALQAAVEESRSALAIAEARMSKARLVSPLTGKVTDVAFDVGEQPGVRQTVVTIQTAQNQFKLVVDVPESDITKVSLNDKVDLTFDAFGDDVHVAGIVGLIDPAEKTVEGVVYYEVTVYLVDPNTSLNLKSGMTLDAAIVTAQVDNVLTIPQRAVLERVDGTKYVRVLTGETTYDERTVTLGLHGDEGKVEVVSGLNEGDKAILTIRPAK